MNATWVQHTGSDLRQGDILRDCAVPTLRNDFSYESVEETIDVDSARLIVVTQSCDLENEKAPHVALCPIHTLDEMEERDAKFAKSGHWEEIRRGKIEGFYMLPALSDPLKNREALVVDFRLIVSLPIGYLTRHVGELTQRPRLHSPYVEHFSQSFARFFMRVGFPSQIPAFK